MPPGLALQLTLISSNLSRTYFHCPQSVRAIEVLLYALYTSLEW